MPTEEIQILTSHLRDVLQGEPWYGEPVMGLLKGVKPEKAFLRPSPEAHSCADILWHMVTWSQFILDRILGRVMVDESVLQTLDWRKLDPDLNTWEEGVREFGRLQDSILAALSEKDDAFLQQQVDYRKYNFRHMLNGLAEHHIYHAGQIAWISKFL